jgi:hypothetical protein
MDECRHNAVRIELEVGGIELVALQVEHMLLGLQAFLRQRQTDFLGADRVGIVVELEHLFHPRPLRTHAAKGARSCGFLKSTGVPFGIIPVGLTRVIE